MKQETVFQLIMSPTR